MEISSWVATRQKGDSSVEKSENFGPRFLQKSWCMYQEKLKKSSDFRNHSLSTFFSFGCWHPKEKHSSNPYLYANKISSMSTWHSNILTQHRRRIPILKCTTEWFSPLSVSFLYASHKWPMGLLQVKHLTGIGMGEILPRVLETQTLVIFFLELCEQRFSTRVPERKYEYEKK